MLTLIFIKNMVFSYGNCWKEMLRQPIHSLSLFIHPVVSDSLQPHELQHARLPCPSSSPGIYPNLCLLSQWCHSTISSSVTRFSCPQSFPESESSPMSQLFTSGVQSIGASALSSAQSTHFSSFSKLHPCINLSGTCTSGHCFGHLVG